MRKYVRFTIVAVLVLVTVGCSASYLLYCAAQHEPEFYQQALRIEPTRQAEAGFELEQGVLKLHNSAREEGLWQATFTEEQINGWLAADLPEKFPRVLPPGAQDPRVAIDSEAIKIACRYQQGKVNSVISFALAVDLTAETNTLAVRVFRVRAGALPVPLKRFLNRITAAGRNADIDLRWSQTEGDPVALIRVPHQHEDYAHREIYLETVELRNGEVLLAGRTERKEEQQQEEPVVALINDQDEKATVQR